MYISELKLWNFRKYGKVQDNWDLTTPHLSVPFNPKTNVLIGENDSGKTAIIDAIKLVLKTHAYEWIKVDLNDFYHDSNKLRIEIIFDGFTNEEAKNFTEWLGWIKEEDTSRPILRLILAVERKNNRILPYEVKAGMDDIGYSLNAEAREYLKVTYLKALRDADNELIAKRNSRLSQILQGHELFIKQEDEKHELETFVQEANEKIKKWFNDNTISDNDKLSRKAQIKDIIDYFLKEFIDDSIMSEMRLSEADIRTVLEKISLGIDGVNNLGLGTMNRLYMATELLHLRKEWSGLKLGLIEELEAHLHPQVQMKVIETLQKEENVQFILTTHSPNLASKLKLHNLILCNNNDVYPLGKESTLHGKGTTVDNYTKLNKKDYCFLERFLDVTKSNLFFARGVILVEGWSEEILIPEIAKKIGCDLTKQGISIVNVGSTAYLHFAKIFLRNDGKQLNIPVAVITDLDVRPQDDYTFDKTKENEKRQEIKKNFEEFENSNVKLFISKQWTLEWCLYKSSLSECFKDSVSEVHSGTSEFKKVDTYYNNKFENKFIDKLAKKSGVSSIDKVAIAGRLAEKIANESISMSIKDEYLKYIIDAIKYVCDK